VVRAPIRVVFSDHAAERATRHGIAYREIHEVVLDEHLHRRRNPGSGDWRLRRRDPVVVYDWPDGGDPATARVITVGLAE
jgi:hypothetical protein